MAFSCTFTPSCSKHIDKTDALIIMARRGNRYKIYSSHNGNSAMAVIDIPIGFNTHISPSLASTFLDKHNVGGGKLYILYNLDSHKYFHMHVKVIGDDTHLLRHANSLCYQIFPNYSYDPRYDHPKHNLYVPTDAWNNPIGS